MDTPDISVYGEAKGEYTRQLCVFLVPSLETYILGLLEEAKTEAPNPKKVLWQFQTILQGIPDWNQDKVLRETEKIQKDCNCDYLEELLTAVFIAHTKVLSAIRLTTRQKKLQITIPKLDHFIHRLLSEAARSLWTNAYLFADCNSIEKQKNFRQVSALLNDSVLQAIRGMLPVKSILREYLHDEEDEDEEVKPEVKEAEEEVKAEAEEAKQAEEVKAEAEEMKAEVKEAEQKVKEAEQEVKVEAEEMKQEEQEVKVEAEEVKAEMKEAEEVKEAEQEVKVVKGGEVKAEYLQETQVQAELKEEQPVIQIDTKPSVSFSNDHVFFDSNSLEANEIQDIPFLDDDEDLTVGDDVLPIETDTL